MLEVVVEVAVRAAVAGTEAVVGTWRGGGEAGTP